MNKIGKRIHNLREEKNLNRDELADLADITPTFLATLEDEELYPSIGPLQKIARALGVRLGTFMDDQVTKDPIILRQDDRTEDLTMQQAKHKTASYHYHSLGKGKSDRNMEPFIIEIAPEEDQTLSSHQGEEFMYVLSGTLKVIYGRETHTLKEGDSIYYNSIVPHYVGALDGNTKILAVLHYPL